MNFVFVIILKLQSTNLCAPNIFEAWLIFLMFFYCVCVYVHIFHYQFSEVNLSLFLLIGSQFITLP